MTLPAPDMATWGPELEARPGATWLGTEWFFAECYVYRCLMTAVRYWETGRDPFAPAKSAELASDELWERVSVAHDGSQGAPADQRLVRLLGASAWGNRVDLSYAVGVAFGAEGEAGDLLCDDREWAVSRLIVECRR